MSLANTDLRESYLVHVPFLLSRTRSKGNVNVYCQILQDMLCLISWINEALRGEVRLVTIARQNEYE